MVEEDLHNGEGGGSGGAQAPAPSHAAAVPPSPRHRGPSKKLQESEMQAAFKLAARGVEVQQIADVLQHPVGRVKRALDSVLGTVTVRRLRGEFIQREVEHHFALHEMLPQARVALEGGLQRGTAKTQTDIARWLHEALIQKPAERKELHVTGKLEHDLSPVIEQIGKSLATLREASAGRNALSRVRLGSETLVRPVLPETME